MICESCGNEIAVGAWPFCPHGRGAFTNIPDDVPGGFTVENGFDAPRTFYSHSAHERALAERGLEIRAKWAGPQDQHLTNWAAGTVDLEAAAALVSRTSKATRKDWPDYEPVPITVTTIRFEDPK